MTLGFGAGGFGVAKNLCDWAVKNKDCTIQSDVERVIKGFHGAGKPLGMCCISPVLAAKLLPGCELTVGRDTEGDMLVLLSPKVTHQLEVSQRIHCSCDSVFVVIIRWPYAQTADALKAMGCKHVNTDVEFAHVDKKNKLITTCAFMCNAPLHKVFDGIGVMVNETLKLA